ncbi:MAG: hypothetical protein AAF363_15605 [Bacteroidota bacterium]
MQQTAKNIKTLPYKYIRAYDPMTQSVRDISIKSIFLPKGEEKVVQNYKELKDLKDQLDARWIDLELEVEKIRSKSS